LCVLLCVFVFGFFLLVDVVLSFVLVVFFWSFGFGVMVLFFRGCFFFS